MNQQLDIHTPIMDSDDWEYTLAGHLLGTNWVLPDEGVDTIGSARHATEREQGQKMEYPEIVFKHSKRRLSVSGFLRRIDPDDIGDIRPSNGDETAKLIREYHTQHGWRSIHSD